MHVKHTLRQDLLARRAAYVATLPTTTRGLLFKRPPAPVAALVPEGAIVGLYHPVGAEAPTQAYARWFHENGRRVALPWFAARDGAMNFRRWDDPFSDHGLARGPFGALQPTDNAAEVLPDAAFIPLIGFTDRCDRLGQGGGHYDRWLAAHPAMIAVGLAWDVQHVASLPVEPHDIRLRAIVTPTRFYEGEA